MKMKPNLSPPPKRLSRRTLLRGVSGVALGLPFLEAMRPRVAATSAFPGAALAAPPVSVR